MARIESWFAQDLHNTVKVRYIDGNLFSQDNAGNLIGVVLSQNGAPYSGGGTVSANVIRADGATVSVAGALSGNVATVVLPQAAYAVVGAVSIIIKLTVSGTITTIFAVIANVYQSSTDITVDPGTIIPSIETLLAEIDAAVASIPADYSSLWESLAPAFSSDESYSAGQYTTYDGGLYRFIADHSGSWSSSDVVAVSIGGELATINGQMAIVEKAEEDIENIYGLNAEKMIAAMSEGKINSNGEAQADGTKTYSDYLNCFECDYIYHIISTNESGCYIAFYNENKDLIMAFEMSSFDVAVGAICKIPVPEYSVYFRTTMSAWAGVNQNYLWIVHRYQGMIESIADVSTKKMFMLMPAGRINASGAVVSDGAARYSNNYIRCNGYRYIRQYISTNRSDCYIAFYDIDKRFISATPMSAATSAVGTPFDFDIPETAYYFRTTMSSWAGLNQNWVFGVLNVDKKLTFAPKKIMLKVTTGYEINASGTTDENSYTAYSDYTSCDGFGYIRQMVTTMYRGGYIAFYDETRGFIKSVSVFDRAQDGESFDFIVPVNAKYFRTTLSVWAANNHNWVFGLTKTEEAINTWSRSFVLAKDGSGDFTNIDVAITEATQYENATLYIEEGTYDVIADLIANRGQTWFDNISSSQRGIYIWNNIHIICSPKAIIQAIYTGSNDSVKEWLAVFNTGSKGFILENATLIGKNIRYLVHDERDYFDNTLYVNKYINCKMYLDNSENDAWQNRHCIGGGMGLNGYIEVDDCYFESETIPGYASDDHAIVSWHCSQDVKDRNAKCRIVVKDCYFEGDGTIRFIGMGVSDLISEAWVSNSSLGTAPLKIVNGKDNVELKTWCNEIRSN